MANKFLEQMKASDWINLGQLATNVVGGAMSGKAAERTAEQAKTQDTWNRLLQQYNAQMAARNQLAAYYDQLNATRAAGRQALLNASPLGEEQEYVGKQALRRGLMGVMGNFQPLAPASADIAGLIRPTSNVLSAFTTPDMQQAASVGATARSLAERRKAKAGVDPGPIDGVFGVATATAVAAVSAVTVLAIVPRGATATTDRVTKDRSNDHGIR